MPTLRVAVVIPALAGGGPQAVFRSLLTTLPWHRIEPLLITFSGEVDRLPPGVQHLRLTSRGATRPVALDRAFRDAGVQVALTTLGANFTVAPLLLKPRRNYGVVVRQANPIMPTINQWRSRHSIVWELAALETYKHLLTRADVVIAQTPPMAREMTSLVPTVRVRCIPNPTNVDLPAPPANRSAGVLTTVGRLAHEKRYETIFECVSSLPPRDRPRIDLFGDGPDRPRLEGYARQLGIENLTRFHGHHDDPWPRVAEDAILVSTSDYEGQSNAVVEAQVRGVPVIVRRTEWTSAALVGAPSGAFDYAPGSPSALAAAVIAAKLAVPAVNWREISSLARKVHDPVHVSRHYASAIRSALRS